jgi:hypothetical protein
MNIWTGGWKSTSAFLEVTSLVFREANLLDPKRNKPGCWAVNTERAREGRCDQIQNG